MVTRVLCMASLVAAACGDPADPLVGELTSASVIVNDGTCTTLDCGLNGPMIDGVYFSELYKPPPLFTDSEITNRQGFRILHYYLSENDWRMNNPSDNQLDVTLGKFKLAPKGAILEVGKLGQIFLVKIDDVKEDQRYWTVTVPDTLHLETYWFKYTTPDQCGPNGCTGYQALCADKPHGDDSAMPAVVFEGDRYWPANLTVTDSDTDTPGTWFNVACAGSLPSKMHLTRRTFAGAQDPGNLIPVPPLDERQAFVNMWSADYCGDGMSFTATGHPIRIRDLANSMRVDYQVGFNDDDVGPIEAVWGPSGALCLTVPRLARLDTVRSHCAALKPAHDLPSCPGDAVTTWTKIPGAVLLSVNPK
jgi:hypothetical protein